MRILEFEFLFPAEAAVADGVKLDFQPEMALSGFSSLGGSGARGDDFTEVLVLSVLASAAEVALDDDAAATVRLFTTVVSVRFAITL